MAKAVILAGGKGTRLGLLTLQTNKHLCPVFDRQMILYPLETLRKAGITEILVVSGKDHYGKFVEFLGSGKDFGADFTYRVQDEAGGIAEALNLAKDYFKNEKQVVVILGDNIFADSPDLSIVDGKAAKVFLKKVNDANRFGVARFDYNKEIESIVEKPKDIKHGYAVTGLYVYPNSVFEVTSRMKPSARGELEITDVNKYYVKLGLLDYHILDGFWCDAGTPESLARSTQWAISQKQKDAEQLKD